MSSPRAALLSAAALLLAGCSSSPMSALGSITGSNKVSETDRVFLMAAGSWDRNHDNIVTCDEWKAYAAELFNGADADRDGFLEPAEWPRIVAVDRMFETADFKYFDRKGAGKISKDEFINRENPAFVLMDKSKTCSLNGDQIATARSTTQYDVSGKKSTSGDPRDAGGEAGRAANGGLGR